MHDYEKRYNVHAGGASRYVNTAEEVLAIIDRYPDDESVWVNEGYAESRDVFSGSEFMGIEFTRRTTDMVLISSLRFEVERRRVQEMVVRV